MKTLLKILLTVLITVALLANTGCSEVSGNDVGKSEHVYSDNSHSRAINIYLVRIDGCEYLTTYRGIVHKGNCSNHAPTLDDQKIRTALANYIESEGCSCCQNKEEHQKALEQLAKLLNVPKYWDGSGYDFGKYTDY
jgi:hypothetical protein